VTADDVWHRALDAPALGTAGLLEGDLALVSVLLVHGSVMNGGVLNAVEDSFSDQELDAVESGFRWFGLEAAARVFADTRAAVAPGTLTLAEREALELEADRQYESVVPDDEFLVDVFEARFAADPAAFAAV